MVSINRYVDGEATEYYFKNNDDINKSMESGKIKSTAAWFKKRKRELSMSKIAEENKMVAVAGKKIKQKKIKPPVMQHRLLYQQGKPGLSI